MELTVYNSQKGRLETISVDFTADNTTWFDPSERPDDIWMITDFNGDLLITGNGRDYPTRIYDASRILVKHDPIKAKELLRQARR